MARLRLVLDTNVVVSALMFPGGALSWLRELFQSDTIQLLASSETQSELVRVMSDPKFQVPDLYRAEAVTNYLSRCETVDVHDPPEVPECRDPFDRPFLELALFAQADALVTGDADLLALAPVFPIPNHHAG